MAELTEADLDSLLEEIGAEFSASDVTSDVFEDEGLRTNFIEGLIELASEDVELRVGGRKPRELLGCKVIDFAKFIVNDAYMLEQDVFAAHHYLGLDLIEILKTYPEEIMTKPDLDFFIWNCNLEKVSAVFEKRGFKVLKHTATGTANIIEVKGDRGSATFIDAKESWQTREEWPKFGIKALFKAKEKVFAVEGKKVRLYLYPFGNGLTFDTPPLDSFRVSVIGRILLWLSTSKDPNGDMLKVPDLKTQRLIIQTVTCLPKLFKAIKDDPSMYIHYKGSLRDLAISLRIIVMNDWNEFVNKNENKTFVTEKHASFLNQVGVAYKAGRWGYAYNLLTGMYEDAE